MSPNGLILLISLSVALADGPPPPPPPPSVDAAKPMDPDDPFALIALARDLSTSRDRRDEQVAVLMSGLRSSGTRAEAAAALEDLLLKQDARASWEAAYRELLATRLAKNDRLLRVRYAESRALTAASRGKAIADLGAMLQENPRDELVRNALGDAYLRNARPDRALAVFADGDSSSQVWKGEVAALLSLGRYDDARRTGGEVVPTVCRTAPAPVPCAVGLRQMGYPEGAHYLLSKAAADTSRGSTERANLYATIAAHEQADNPAANTVWLWQKAVALDRGEPRYRRELAKAELRRRRPDRARRLIADTRDPLYRTIQAVEIINKTNIYRESASTRARIEEARALDGKHPIVVQAWAHHLIVSGEPEKAVVVLDGEMDVHGREAEWRKLYVWAAGSADQPEKAADALRVGLDNATSSPSWQRLRTELATYEAIAGNAAKQSGKLDVAVARLRLAHGLDPLSVGHLVALGGSHWERATAARDPITRDAELARTEAAFEAAISNAPRNRDALLALVGLLRSQGRAEEARRMLVASGYTDAAIVRLERELEMYAVAQDARDAAAMGQFEVARERFEQLLLVYPGEKVLLHGLADAYSGLGDHEKAAKTYALARHQDPDDLWLALGEVRARIAVGTSHADDPDLATSHLDRAEYVLDAIGRPESMGEAQAWDEANALLERGRADLVAAQGDTQKAYKMYRRLLDADSSGPEADAVLYSGLAGLYMSTWQYGAAEAYYEEALDMDSDLDEAERGVVRALAAKGEYENAMERASRLAVRRPTARNIALSEEVARRYAIDDAARHALEGDTAMARRILEEQRAVYPEAIEVRVALAAVSLRQGDADGAFDLAAGVLKDDPVNPGGLAAMQAAALEARRTKEAVPYYQAAYEATGQSWLKKEITALELADHLNRALDAHNLGQKERAREEIHEAARFYGDATSRHWTMIGTAWLEVDNMDQAMAAFATARHLNDRDSGAAIGMAGVLQARGQPGAAKAILKDHWEEHQDIDVGIALAEVQSSMGQHMAAERTLETVREKTRTGGVRSSAPAPEALPVKALPSGRTAPSARTEARKPPDVPASLPPTSVREVESELERPYRFGASAGVGTAARPGSAQRNYLGVTYFPVAAELAIWRQLRVQAEVVPTLITDGVNELQGTSASGAVGFGIGDALAASARVGTSLQGPDLPADPYLTWSGTVSARLAKGFTAGLETVRSPVTDSLHSYVGTVEDDGSVSGRVRDSWLGMTLAKGWTNGSNFGVLGRWGTAEGLLLSENAQATGIVPWVQGLAYGRAPVFSQGAGSLWLGGEFIYLNHDRQVDGFGAGGGGMFSPDVFYSAFGRVEGLLGDDPDSTFTACGIVGVGPQVVQGDPTLYLGPGTNLGYELRGSLAWNLADRWALVGHVMHQGSWAVWSQTTAMAQLRFGRSENTLPAPSMTHASLVHGPPMLEPLHCSVQWNKVEADR